MSKRKQIRDKIFDRVILATDFSASNTFKGRKYQGDAIEALPTAVVYFNSESRDEQSFGPSPSQNFVFEYTVEVYAGRADSDNTDEELDRLTDAVIAQVLIDRDLGGIVFNCRVSEINYEINAEADDVYGVSTISFEIEYNI